ncbi:hypothetical protein GR254_24985, partial [Mycobacterium tuberculosis]|nr:hypothetical protein [Mycobacterium tuberculosis]
IDEPADRPCGASRVAGGLSVRATEETVTLANHEANRQAHHSDRRTGGSAVRGEPGRGGPVGASHRGDGHAGQSR